MKGIVLAGGSGTRLHPVTLAVSKQLLPIYDKPMIYYPLSSLLLSGIRDILIISTPHDTPAFQRLLGDGSQWGVSFSYATQPSPDGLAQAFIIGREFVGNDSVCRAAQREKGATVFGYQVKDPERYGVVEFDSTGKAIKLEEKPKNATSPYAVTGIYFYDNQVLDIARDLKPSPRGELEITDVNIAYLTRDQLNVELLGRGVAWFDTGTHESLLHACNFIQTIQERQGLMIACLEEIAYQQKFISADELALRADAFKKSSYGQYLQSLLK
jgi:glucose-1-phosphate thymidylyltransferase